MNPTEILAVLQLFTTYGPALATGIENLRLKLSAGNTVTLADVEAEFSGVQPYASFGVRDADPA